MFVMMIMRYVEKELQAIVIDFFSIQVNIIQNKRKKDKTINDDLLIT